MKSPRIPTGTCFSSLDICFLASDWALKYWLMWVKSHLLRLVIVLFSSEVISLQKEISALSFHTHQFFMHSRAYPTTGSLNRNNRQVLTITPPKISKFLHRLTPAELKEERTSSSSYGGLGSDLPRHWAMLHHFPKNSHTLTGTAEGWGENPRNISRKTASNWSKGLLQWLMTEVNISILVPRKRFPSSKSGLHKACNSYTPWCCNTETWLCWFRKAFMVGSFLVKLQDKWETSQLQCETALSCLNTAFVCMEQQPLLTDCTGDTGHVSLQARTMCIPFSSPWRSFSWRSPL